MHSYKALLFTVPLAALTWQSAWAQSYLSPDPPPHSIEDRFRLEVDVLYGSYDTQIRLDNITATPPVPGTIVSAEEDLGMQESQALAQVELTLLPGKHHLIRLGALSMKRDGDVILTRQIRWDEATFNVGDRVVSYFNLSMAGLTYGYLPWRNDKFEAGFTFGVQIASLDANVEAPAVLIREPESASGPIPMFGLEGRYDFTRRWSVDARWQYLSLAWAEAFGADLKGKEATLSDGRIAVRWRQNQHLVYGLGYRSFKLDVLSPNTDPTGTMTLNMSGPLLFVQASL